MLLAIIIGAAAGIAFSPVCEIRRVVVIAPSQSTAVEVAQKVKLAPGANTLLLPIRHFADIAERSYRVERLVVERRSLNEIAVHVHERQPIAAVKTNVGCTLISDEGICLINTDTTADLPVIKGLITKRHALGSTLPEADVQLIMAAIRGAQFGGIARQLQVDFTHPYLTIIKTADGVVGKLGDRRNIERKTALFARLLTELQNEGKKIQYIDVRIEQRPAFREIGERGGKLQ